MLHVTHLSVLSPFFRKTMSDARAKTQNPKSLYLSLTSITPENRGTCNVLRMEDDAVCLAWVDWISNGKIFRIMCSLRASPWCKIWGTTDSILSTTPFKQSCVQADIYETRSLHNLLTFSLEDLKALYKPRFSPLTFVPSMCLKVSSEQYSKLEHPFPVAVKGRKPESGSK